LKQSAQNTSSAISAYYNHFKMNLISVTLNGMTENVSVCQ